MTLRHPASLGLAALSALAAASCRELATVVDVAFPATVPGLPSDQPWASLPVRRWLTETGIEPIAVSACFAPACTVRAAAMLFRARGPEAIALARAASDTAGFAASLKAGPRRIGRPGARPSALSRVTAFPVRDGAWSGYSVSLSRTDGRRAAAGYVLARTRGETTTALVIVAPTVDDAGRLAGRIVPNLGD